MKQKNSGKTMAKNIFELMKKERCRQITFHYNPKTGLKLIWVIDSIPEKRDRRGKLSEEISTSGGTRFAHKNPDIALHDALKLARDDEKGECSWG